MSSREQVPAAQLPPCVRDLLFLLSQARPVRRVAPSARGAHAAVPPGHVGPAGNTPISAPCVPTLRSLRLTLRGRDAPGNNPTPTLVLSTPSTCYSEDPRVPGLQRLLPHQTAQAGDSARSCPAKSVSTASKTIEVWYLQADLKESRKTRNN